MANPPIVYIFHGNDEVALREKVSELHRKLGDAATAEMNTSRFEGSFTFDTLRSATQAAPFWGTRRLVIVSGASKVFSAAQGRSHFTQFLDEIPSSTALVLLEEPLDKNHWLLKWAQTAPDRALVREFQSPEGGQLTNWLLARAKALGGELIPQAAVALAQLVGSDKNAAEQEIQKLLAYVAYRRPVEMADVAAISLPSGEQGDFFGLLDALGAGDSARAMQALEALLQERDLIMLFFSLVGHFRALLRSREMLDSGMVDSQIASKLGLHPYRAQKLTAQARRFSIESLTAIHRRLLEYDERIKTGRMEPDLAMENFVAELSAQAM